MSKPIYHSSFTELLNKNMFDTQFINDEWPKLEQAADVHGYRGASKKKHNGIVPIRPTDKGLLKTLKKLVLNEKNEELIEK